MSIDLARGAHPMPSDCQPRHLSLRVLPAAGQRTAPVSRMSRKRFTVLLVVQALMIVHVLHWLWAETTLAPIEPSETMETVKHGVITVGTIFFALALGSTAILGRWFCGWGCHVVLLQDACAALLARLGIRPRPFRSRVLLWLPFLLALYMFVWPLVYRLALAPIMQPDLTWPGFSMKLVTDDYWTAFPGWAVGIPFLLVCGALTVVFLGNKGYCTYACPYGGFFAPLDRFARARIRVSDACDQCGHCTAVCTSNVRVHEEVRDFRMVVDSGCMKCMDCVSACPKQALSFGFGAGPGQSVPAAARLFDLSIANEVLIAAVGGVSFLAAYSLLPLLFASGLAACITWVVWTGWCALASRDASALGVVLRQAGRLRAAGAVAVIAAVGALAVVLPTAAAGVAAWTADRLDRKVLVAEQMVFDADGVLPDRETLELVDAASAWYSRARSIGQGGWAVLPSRDREFSMRLAWLAAVKRDHARALELLQAMHAEATNEIIAMSVARILRAARRGDESRAWVADALAGHPAWEAIREEEILWLMSEARNEEAIEAARAWVAARPDSLNGLRRLSVVLVERGSGDGEVHEGIALVDRTLELAPGNAGAMLVKANGLARLGQNNAAVATLQEAVRMAPAARGLWEALADACARAGREMEAQAAFAEAERLAAEEQKRLEAELHR
ncbi:MAG: 4Fe-4S binding protein [Planctomycetes bacterium]|nr:4Fe-4S binding protein [Planctomycetota bacterium]